MPHYRFGKHPPKVDYRTLRFYAKAGTADPTKSFPMDRNDTLGDCTIAALAHAVTTYRGLVGTQIIMSKQAAVKSYMHLTGGLDTGLNELDVLNYWRQHAVSHDKILAFVSIDSKNHIHIQQAIHLFGGVYLGFQVQENCVQEFDARQPWTPGPLTNNGHAVFAVWYDKNGVTVLTWRNTQQATWGWWDECVDEACAMLPPDAKDPQFAPGFNLAQLQSRLGCSGELTCKVPALG
jgi:hypothetical protein